ncbi:hypothetical protein D3C81_334790 [compost metagenome]
MSFLRLQESKQPNMTPLGGAMYVVRTQAGLRKAIKEQFDDWKEMEVYGRPKKYPAIVAIVAGRNCGIDHIQIASTHLNVVKDVLAQQGEI